MPDPTFGELMAPPEASSTVVVNLKTEAYDVYIGRGSPWGNPYRIGCDGDRGQVVDLYETYMRGRLAASKPLRRDLLNLRGKRLGCFCKPLPCHGDVLMRLMQEAHDAEP